VSDAATQQLKTQPLSPAMTEPADDATLELGATIAGYQVLELREEQPDMRVYRAQAPADLCLQCGTRSTEPNARFCENCGAELLPRDVLLLEPLGDTPARGPWLALNLPADPRQALLPPLTPLEHNGTPLLVVEATIPGWQSLAELLINHGAAPDQPAAVQDDDAFVLARQLADALHYLHSNGVALGELSLAHLLVGPQGRLRLRDLDSLEPLTPESQRADLGRLLATLEEITRQPRTTQKLDGALLEGDGQRSLQDVLGLARAGRLPDVEGWITALDAVQQSQRAVTPLQVHVAGHSDVGRVRELNEDALLTLNLDVDMAGRSINAGLYVVADGMGGHEAGEVASNLAIQSMANDAAPALVELLAESANGITFEELKLVAARAALHANEAVYAEGRRRGNDMGTTLTFALVVGDRCVVGNVGDSRTYMYRNGELQRVTSDHSLVQRLVDMGQITPDEVYTHPHRNAILRSLGENPNVETDLFELRLQPGDALLLCSDGLWEMVRDDRLEAIMVNDDVHAAVEQVVDEANRNGGEDNIAAVLVQFAADAATGSAAQTHAAKEEHTNV
jgi:protein phosphatase